MIKVGDRVAPINYMSKTGVVIDMKSQQSEQWMVGGAMEALFIVKVRMDHDGTDVEFRADDLMRVD